MYQESSVRRNIFLISVTDEDWLIAELWMLFACFCSLLRNINSRLPSVLASKVTQSLLLIPTKGRQGWLYTIALGSDDGQSGEVAFGE